MAEQNEEICLRIHVLNPQHQPLGGTVDVDCKPHGNEAALHFDSADASGVIDIRGLRRDLDGPCEVTVTPTGSSQSVSQLVTVPAEGFQTVLFFFDATAQSTGASASKACRSSHTLSGNLVTDHGLPAAGVVTRLYNVGFAGQDTLLGHTTTGTGGSYSITYAKPATGAANLQVRVLNPPGKEVTLSTTKYDAAAQETLNLVVPSSVQPLAPEFQRFASDMNQTIGSVARLAHAQENAGQQDLTLVNQSTNWDARLTAFGALSAQHAATVGIDQEALYAMYRVGLPTDPGTLAKVPATTVQKALTTANSAGIASLNEKQVAATISAFTNFASKSQLAATTPGAVSTFSQMA